MSLKKILVIAGTRPEAIKTVAVVKVLHEESDWCDVTLCASGQHREMLTQAFADFGIEPNINLDIMTANQTLSGLSSRLFSAIDDLYETQQPDAVLVQGDTTTVQVAALAAFYRRIPVGHIEAGLRSHHMLSPFPEELNRRVAGLVAKWHFAPTKLSQKNLLSEGIDAKDVFVTGNTVIDALLWMRARVKETKPALPGAVEKAISEGRRVILVTGHRRESFGQGFKNICQALDELSTRFPEDRIVYPMHLNPNVREVVGQMLVHKPGIILCEPQTYSPFIRLMDSSHLILTDSGGIQEEGPSLGKPVLVMRELTERPEGVEAGVNILVGTETKAIVDNAAELLSNQQAYNAIATTQNPYGDGAASQRIVTVLKKHFRG